MAVTENDRLRLRARLNEVLGETDAAVLMESVPPLDYEQFATKESVSTLTTVMNARFDSSQAEYNARFDGLSAQLRGEIAELRADMRTEMGELRTELRTEMGELRADVKSDLANQLRVIVGTQVVSLLSVAGIVAGLT